MMKFACFEFGLHSFSVSPTVTTRVNVVLETRLRDDGGETDARRERHSGYVSPMTKADGR